MKKAIMDKAIPNNLANDIGDGHFSRRKFEFLKNLIFGLKTWFSQNSPGKRSFEAKAGTLCLNGLLNTTNSRLIGGC